MHICICMCMYIYIYIYIYPKDWTVKADSINSTLLFSTLLIV